MVLNAERIQMKLDTRNMTKRMSMGAMVIAVMACLAGTAMAQSRTTTTFTDRYGRLAGRSMTDGRGTTTFYDRNGRLGGRSRTDTRGHTTFYDRNGRFQGRSR